MDAIILENTIEWKGSNEGKTKSIRIYAQSEESAIQLTGLIYGKNSTVKRGKRVVAY